MSAASSENAAPAGQNPYLSVIILTLATFMETLDLTIAAVALPRITGDLSVSPSEGAWVLSSYFIANAAVIPISSWFATYFGRKRFYLLCVVGFTVTSLLCGFAPSLELLIFFRVLQGVTGGGLAPSEQAILADITPKEKLGRIFSIYGIGLTVASVIAPTLGGVITDYLGWRFIFFINIPIGIISFILTSIYIRETPEAESLTEKFRREGGRVDWFGMILIVVGVIGIQLIFEQGPTEGWFESDYIVLISAASVIILLAAIFWEKNHTQPAIDLSLFKLRGFTAATILIFSASFIFTGGMGFLMPFLTQFVLDYSATETGLVALPGTILLIIGIQISGILTDKFEARSIIIFGYCFIALAFWNLSVLTTDIEFSTLTINRSIATLSLASIAVAMNTSAYYGLPADKNSSASSMLNFSRTIGTSFGYSVVSTLIFYKAHVNFAYMSESLSSFNQNFTQTIANLSKAVQFGVIHSNQAGGAATSVILDIAAKEAYLLAVIGVLQLFSVMAILSIPLVFLLNKRNPKTGTE